MLEQIGQGGMGQVFRARKGTSERLVALKLGPNTRNPKRLERFRREGEITAELRHPNIVAVHDAGVVAGQPFLAYHLVEDARTLDQVLPTWPLRRRIEAVRDIARALGYAHARGIVHRDVKPENVLVTPEGATLLADFGLASAVTLERLTVSQALLGTPLYMAPEQALASYKAGPSVDVYSLGVILYEALVGEHPFAHVGMPALLDVETRRFRAPAARDAAVPRELSHLCMQALQPDPARRIPNGDALADALDAWLRGEALPVGERRGALLGGVLLAAAVGFGAFVAWPKGETVAAQPEPPTRAPIAPPEAELAELRPGKDPAPEPLRPEEQAALDRARAALRAAPVDVEALKQALPLLNRALSPADEAHSAFADELLAYLRDPGGEQGSEFALPLLEELARSGARPGARAVAERMCESLYWSQRFEPEPSGMLRGLIALVRMDVDVDGVNHGFKREATSSSFPDSAPLRYLRARYAHALTRLAREQGPSEALIALGEEPELGPVTRARALALGLVGERDPARRLRLAERALALDPFSGHVRLAHARALLVDGQVEAGRRAHRDAWAAWCQLYRERDGAVEEEEWQLQLSVRALLAQSLVDDALEYLDLFEAHWQGRAAPRVLRRVVGRAHEGAARDADRTWIERGGALPRPGPG
ncbi:MAG: serine/threonine protein kinase [Planctomycetes bacterium]|nr:serine/threonine protein kinase [Planctomycetota bacterium]